MAASFDIPSGKITLTAAATKSLLLLNPVTNEAKITEISVSLDAAAAAAGVAIDLYIVTSIGSPAGTSVTPGNINPTQQAATTTALAALSAEPTTVVVRKTWAIQPIGGLMVYQLPLGREYTLAAAGARWGLRYTTAAAVTPDCWATITIEE